MAREALKALSRKSLTLDELFETLESFDGMPPQAEILISYSLLEDALKWAILKKLPQPLSTTEISNLFESDGPLSSISARTNLASALGIIGKDTRADIGCIKDIRNSFAHARVTLSFDNVEVANACRDLTAIHRMHGRERFVPPITEGKTTREIFRMCFKLTWMHIHQAHTDGPPVLDTP